MPKFRLFSVSDGRQAIVDTELYKAFFTDSQAFAAVLDSAGRIADVNDAARRMSGLHSDESEHRWIWVLPNWTDESRSLLRQAIASAANGTVYCGIVEVRTAGGGSVNLDFSLRPACTNRDGADMLILEARPTEPVGHTLGLEVFTDFADLAAHDLNNLFAAIAGNLELLARRQTQDEIAHKRLNRLQRSVFRGRVLTGLIDAFVHPVAAAQPVELAPILRDAVDECRSGLNSEVDLTSVIDERLWPCRGDTESLSAALLQLIVHVHDLTPPSGPIEVHASNMRLGDGQSVSSPDLPAGDYVAVKFLQPEAVTARTARILPGASREQANIGLGLRIVRAIAGKAGGELVVGHPDGSEFIAGLYLSRVPAEE